MSLSSRQTWENFELESFPTSLSFQQHVNELLFTFVVCAVYATVSQVTVSSNDFGWRGFKRKGRVWDY